MEPVRGNHRTHFYHAWAEAIDLDNRKLVLMPAYPPVFREGDPLQAGATGEATSDRAMYPNARGGDSTMLARAPHRRAIEARDGTEDDKVMESSHQTGHHSHTAGESWRSMEEGREYELAFDKLVVS